MVATGMTLKRFAPKSLLRSLLMLLYILLPWSIMLPRLALEFYNPRYAFDCVITTVRVKLFLYLNHGSHLHLAR